MGDLLVILLGLYVGFWVRFQSGWVSYSQLSWWNTGGSSGPRPLSDYLGLICVGAVLLSLTFSQLRLYRSRNLLRFRKVVTVIARGVSLWFLAYLTLSLVLKFTPPISRIYVTTSAISTLILLLVWRAAFHRLLQVDSVAGKLRQRVIFVGWNDEAAKIANAIFGDRSHPYDILGCLPAGLDGFSQEPGPEVRRLGASDDLPAKLAEGQVDIVILAEMEGAGDRIVALTNLCERALVQFKVIPSYFQILVSGLQAETISGVPILGVSELPLDRVSNRLAKRLVDLVGAMVGLAISAPLVALFGVLIYAESPGPIFFRQERVGRGGRRFQMFKLRSMRLDADKADHLSQSTQRDDPRLLRVGAFIRRWNIDETPQFWNVLCGHMSLVGPRPERTFHTEKLSAEIPHYSARLMSKPGMTGWAQVNGLRGETDLTERVRYDLFYLENWNLWLDFQIMIQTFFRRDNAY